MKGKCLDNYAPKDMKDTPRAQRIAASFSALFLIAAATGTIAAPPPDDTFRDLILQRLQAFSRGDSAGYRKLLTDDFVHIDDSGKRRTAEEMAPYTSVGNSSRWEVSQVHARLITDALAIVDCQALDIAMEGSREVRRPLHETDVFVLREGRWLYLEHAETHVLSSPKAITPDPKVLDDYVGQYEFWPGRVDTFTRTGDQLFARDEKDKEPTPLLSATNESFFVEGEADLIIFVRDASGKVTHELGHAADGHLFVAQKLK